MFTGIIQHVGRVAAARRTTPGLRLTIDMRPLAADAMEGSSIAVDGVCLTVCGLDGTQLSFDVVAETLDRSTLGRIRVNDRVNLEPALRADGRLDGHFVQGHVDGIARVTRREESAGQCVLWFGPPAELMRCVIPKGSVAVAGVSLTVADLTSAEFSVAVIPTTLAQTTLADRRVGDEVNLETDLLARTIVHTLGRMETGGGLTEAMLREQGYAS
ncbi:MAG: riboflavin synthase [bacterium]|nr:riboflavin synthase [bacterium]